MALITHPFAHVKELDAIGHHRSPGNLGSSERIGSVVGGLALACLGMQRRSALTPLFLLAGGLLIRRGTKGQCELYRRLGIDTSEAPGTRGVPDQMGYRVEKSIIVDATPAHVYGSWRRLENLPKFMPHLKSVTESDDGISHWVVEGPAGRTVTWDSEIINEHPGSMIAWQTLPGADVQSAGTVRFEPLSEGARTKIHVTLKYNPPLGPLGALAAQIFGEAPDQQLSADLKRFKKLIEIANLEDDKSKTFEL